MSSLQLLIIDDEPAIRQILSKVAADAGHSVSIAANGDEALTRLAKGDIDVAVCDIRMPDLSGIEVVENARQQGIDTLFLMMTAFASVNTAIEAMRAGAYDYMIKPLRNEDFLNRLEQLADVIHLKSENKVLRELIKNQSNETWLKVSQTSSTVLITGPSGSGKSVIAELIHQNSPRKDRPFIPVNCGAIPENLLESEFFGHTKGAKASFLVTPRAPLPAPTRQKGDFSSKPTRARFSSTRSASFRLTCRSSCYTSSKTRTCAPSAANSPGKSTCASSPPPTRTWTRWYRTAVSGKTCTSVSTCFRFRYPRCNKERKTCLN
jgi:CheY-like chemotaxis protein